MYKCKYYIGFYKVVNDRYCEVRRSLVFELYWARTLCSCMHKDKQNGIWGGNMDTDDEKYIFECWRNDKKYVYEF